MKYLHLTMATLLAFVLSAGSSMAQDCTNEVLIVIATESFGSEITWNITNADSSIVASGGPYTNNAATTIVTCLEDGCYSFNMMDSWGDGWNGGLSSIIFGDAVVGVGTLDNGDFGSYSFGINAEDCAENPIFGCTNADAINYDPEATFDDQSCEFECTCSDEYEPVCVYDGNFGEYYTFNNICEAECAGYLWIVNFGTCEDPIAYGCTDEEAANFDPNATDDDGSCEYLFECDAVAVQLYICTFSNGQQVRLDLMDSDGNLVYQSGELTNSITYVDLCLDETECYTAVMYNSEGLTGWYNGYFWINANGVQITNEALNDDLTEETSEFAIDGSCGSTFGCTDEEAANYNPNATDDDGTCYYPCICDDQWAPVCAFNPAVGDWMTYPNACSAECDGIYNYVEGECNFIGGCTNPLANNFNPEATNDDGSCEVSACLDTFVPYTYCYSDNINEPITYTSDEGTGISLFIESGSVESNFDLLVVYDGNTDGDIIFSADGDLSGVTVYAPSGTLTIEIQADGSVSCDFGIEDPIVYTVSCGDEIGGCTDETALNFNQTASYDDGSCEYEDPCDGSSATVVFTTGTFANEVSWFISDENGNVVASGEGYETGQTYVTDLCLSDGCYALNAIDLFGDGWNGGVITIEVAGISFDYTLEQGSEDIYNFGVNAFDCATEIEGCTDEEAANFDPNATDDDGSCEYPFECENGIEAELYICTFSSGENVALTLFDEEGNEIITYADLDNVQVMYTDVCLPEGCISAVMTNSAGENGWYNGYFWIQVNGETIITESLNDDASSETTLFSLSGSDCPLEGCTDDEALNFNPNANIDNGSCEYAEPCEVNQLILYTSSGTWPTEVSWNITDEFGNVVAEMEDIEMTSLLCLEDGCYTINMMDSFGDGWNGAELIISSEDTTIFYTFDSGDSSMAVLSINSECEPIEISGCTDENAFNYNPNATIDDGSCEYFEDLLGCTNPEALNFNPNATVDDGSCEFEQVDCDNLNQVTIYISTAQWGTEISWNLIDDLGNSVASGDGYSSYASYSTVNCLADGCYTLELNDSWGDGWNGAYYMIYDDGGLYAEGTLLYGSAGMEIISINSDCEVAGCTDPDAINFSPIATVDDGNCVYSNPFSDLDPEDFFGLDLLVNLGPNPFEDEFIVTVTGLKDELPVNMKIINMMGQLVTEYQETPSNERVIKDLNGSAWTAGTYFLTITQGDQQVSKMLVKQ